MFTNFSCEQAALFSSTASVVERFEKKLFGLQAYGMLAACVVVILSVSIYDTYLVYFFRNTILENERNPICTALIQRDPANLSWFFGGKAIGNLLVVSVLAALFRFRYRHRNLVAFSVAGFQVLLTIYLCLSDPQTGFFHFDGLYSNSPRVYRNSLDSLAVHIAAASVLAAMASVVYRIRKPNLIVRNRGGRLEAREFYGILR